MTSTVCHSAAWTPAEPERRWRLDVTAVVITEEREPAIGKWWWVLLVTGILWILIGLYVLQAHYGSAVAIGYLVGFWLLFAGVAEFIEIGGVTRWKWVHGALGALFVVGGIA